MPTDVTVALLGDPARPGARIEEHEWTRTWNDRLKTVLAVNDDESVGSVADRSLSDFGVVLQEGMIGSYIVDIALHDDVADRVRAWDMTLVDDDGRVVWAAYDLRLVPYSQLVQSVAAGAVRGDPRRLYVILKEPVGNGLGIDWATLVQAWHVVDEIVGRVGEYGGAIAAVAGAYNYVRRHLREGSEAVVRNAPRWSQRGGNPYDVFQLLTSREQWAEDDLAQLLGCSQEDVARVLGVFGFARSEHDGLWHREGDDAARVLAAAFEEAAATHFDVSDDEKREFETRIEQLVQTGERPPERTYDLFEEPKFFELVSFAISPEGFVGHGRIGRSEVHIQRAAEDAPASYAQLWSLAYQLTASEVVRLATDVHEAARDAIAAHDDEPDAEP